MNRKHELADPMTIVFVSSEAQPFSKTGGLADVSGSLTKALAELGHNVHLFTPLYKSVDRETHKIPKRGKAVQVPISSRTVNGNVLSIKKGRLSTHFIEHDGYFGRDNIYSTPKGDYADNSERFVFFSRAALEGIKALKIKPDVIHVNDWQTSLIPVYLKTLLKNDPALGRVPSVLTIHNLAYQGVFWELDWHLTGLPWEVFETGGLKNHGQINFLKGGIIFADMITTVSKTYAEEIQGKKFGCGLESVLIGRKNDLFGVINGIDTEIWNPATDPLIPANYSARSLKGKKTCKEKLLSEFGLPPGDQPLLGVVSRLVEQKGLDMLGAVIDKILDLDVRFVLLGTGQKEIENIYKKLALRRPDKVGARIGYDEALAHQIEAGTDIFLMPSRYEPCGLNQMYSLAYGSIPVVHATGGLNDTVEDCNGGLGSGNGFKFHKFSAEALYDKVEEAVNLFKRNPAAWYKIVRRGMKEDFSWKGSASIYEKLYRKALKGGVSW